MATERQTQADQMKRVTRIVVDEAINEGDLSALEKAYSPDVIWHGPGGREIQGVAGMKEMIAGYRGAFPDLHMTVEREITEGDTLALAWRCVGTHEGPLGDIQPTGKRVDIRGQIISRFEGGRIVEELELFDELQMLRQIGAVAS